MTNTEAPHARAFDLPGWPCPPRVRDIAARFESWGWVRVTDMLDFGAVAQDELGFLWIDGDAVPCFKLPDDSNANPGGVAFWTERGVGVWIHPSSLRYLRSISRLDMEPDRWLPVAVALAELPAFVTAAAR